MKILDNIKRNIAGFLPKIQNKLVPSQQEKKNFGPYDPYSFYGYLFSQGFYDLSAYMAIAYYKQCSPVFTATSIITREVKSIRPVVMDKMTLEHIKPYPIEILTNLPNADVTWDEFIEQLATYFLITGNAFAIITGRFNGPPLEIYCQPPQGVTMTYATDGFVNQYNVGIQGINLTFTRQEIKGRFRYFSADGTKEIWHIRSFNPYTQYYTGMGMSPLAPIYYELEQHLASSTHNLSLLKRGARPSLLLSFQDELSDEQYSKLREEMHQYYASEFNAGRILVAPNRAEVKEMSITNKDMDFLNLKIEATHAIYNALGVPLPLVSGEQMTYSNLEEANLRLYNSAVIPTSKKIYGELSNFLMHRYPDGERLVFTFDPRDIPALEPVKSRLIKEKQATGIYTLNELRAIQGLPPSQSAGADEIYLPSNLYPVATAEPGNKPSPTVTLEEDEELNEQEEEYRNKMRIKFKKILSSKIDDNGDRIFSDADIERYARQNNL